MANVTLGDIKEQLIANQEETNDDNKKTHEILQGIASELSSYFKYLRQSRLDELEKQRELKNQAASTKPTTLVSGGGDDGEEYSNPFATLGKIGAVAAAVAGSIAGVLETYRKFWVNQHTSLGRTLSRSFTNIGVGFNNIGKEVNAGFMGVKNLAVKDFSTLSGKIGAITKIISVELTKPFLLVKAAIETVQSGSNRFFRALMTPFTAIGKFFSDLIEIFKNAKLPTTTGIVEGIQSVVNRLGIFGSFLRGTFLFLKNTVAKVLGPLVALYGAVTGFLDTEGNTFQKILGAIKGAFESFVQFIFIDFGKFILDGIAGIFRFFSLDTIANAFNSISDGIQAVFDGLMNGLQLLIEDPSEFANKAMQVISNGFNTVVEVVGDFFTSVFDSLVSSVKAIAQNPLGFASSLLGERSRKLLGLEDEYQAFQDAKKPDVSVAPEEKPLERIDISKQPGRVSADDMKNITDKLADLKTGGGNVTAVMSAPTTVTNSSNNVTATGSSSATDRKAPEG